MMEDLTGEEVARLLKGEHVPRRPSALNKAATPAEGQRRANGGPAVSIYHLEVDIPLPGPGCNPNSHAIWQVRHASVVKLREATGFAAAAELTRLRCGRPEWSQAVVQAIFYKPGKRSKIADGDNLNSSLKAAFDGLQDAGVITNDSGLRVLPAEQLIGDAAGRNRKVTLVIQKGLAMSQTTLDRIKFLCQQNNHPGVNEGAHRLAGTVLKIIAEGEKPPLLARFDKCIETLRCYFHAGQDGDAAVCVLETEIRPVLENALRAQAEAPAASSRS